MACYTLGAFLLGPLNGLLSSVGQLQQCLPAAQRLFEIFDLVVEENSGRLMLPQERGVDIRLRNLSFAFPGRGRLLTDVNVVMPRGKVTLFTGPSGGGKSTLLALLIAQHRPTNGEVLLDGVGIDHYDLAGLRHSVGFVPQRIDLFSRDLLSNLTMDDPNPDLRRVLSLCQRVGLDSMIESLPSKLHTEVRDGGVNFSGGQRQKMAVVRALYRNPKLLLMDEPTSAYDAESEDQFLQLLSDLRSEGCTIVIASHSARIHAIADLVYEIRAGIVQAKLGQRSTSPLLSA
jgi:ATP-binding cassette subfamily B protein